MSRLPVFFLALMGGLACSARSTHSQENPAGVGKPARKSQENFPGKKTTSPASLRPKFPVSKPIPAVKLKPGLPLDVKDKGVFSIHDRSVSIQLPADIAPGQTSIYVNKDRRIMVLYASGVAIKVYPVALGGAPLGPKKKMGDQKTPEGDYYICERRSTNLPRRYGARSLRLSYPNAADARSAFTSRLISQKQLRSIEAAIRARKMPPQNTPLGSSLRIHGGGVSTDWTLGCIAMRDPDVIEIFRCTQGNTPVAIAAAKTHGDRDGDGIPDQVDILMGAIKLTMNKASYDPAYFPMKYPMGDVPAGKGVCTDVIIRAMRNAGYDLQELIHEDIRAHASRYKNIVKADRQIDHRRVKNMITYFLHHFKLLDRGFSAATRHTYRPGDIVFMDTLPKAGPDHVGIVADTRGTDGNPLIINNWTTGCVTARMALLSTVPVTHHFRITSP